MTPTLPHRPRSTPTSRPPLAAARRSRTAAVLLLAVVALAGCGSNAVEPQAAPDLADLQPFLGREVTVTAEVAELESPRAFTVIEREGSGAEPLLVVHAERPEPVAEDLPITVTGTVGIFDAQRNLVGAQDPARLTQYDGKPYIDASSLAAPDPG